MVAYMKKNLDELSHYCPPLTKRDDFDQFWNDTIALSRKAELNPSAEEIDYPLQYVRTFKISYDGYDHTRVHGWYLLPRFAANDHKIPCVVCYHGFGGGMSLPQYYAQWLLMGAAVIAIDCRLQGGDTSSNETYNSGLVGNVTSLGILDKDHYYFRAVYMDCCRAIDFAFTRPEIDTEKIVVTGGSQGGALTIAVASLDQRVALAMADVPSNSNIEARIEGKHGSFSCLAEYLCRYPERIDKVYETLSYFDTMNLADRIKCPVLAAVCLKDDICPAKCFFATFNRITSEKEIKVYPFNGHDGGGITHEQRKLEFLQEHKIVG